MPPSPSGRKRVVRMRAVPGSAARWPVRPTRPPARPWSWSALIARLESTSARRSVAQCPVHLQGPPQGVAGLSCLPVALPRGIVTVRPPRPTDLAVTEIRSHDGKVIVAAAGQLAHSRADLRARWSACRAPVASNDPWELCEAAAAATRAAARPARAAEGWRRSRSGRFCFRGSRLA